jgi:hypothetical protein
MRPVNVNDLVLYVAFQLNHQAMFLMRSRNYRHCMP